MKDDARSGEKFFLGLDSSTQGLKATLVDDRLDVVHESIVNFDRDLPEFETVGGVHRSGDGHTVTSPPMMWVAALDLLMDRLLAAGCPLGQVVAVSGSGQQHGSVWIRRRAHALMSVLDPSRPLRDHFGSVFSLDESPVWMDTSTTAECQALEAGMGGAQVLADITGSRAYERFTGNQIARISRNKRDIYLRTERISLVSSFMCSLLIGDYAPIDVSDGSGMNLMDIRTREWSGKALSLTAPDLAERLGKPVLSHTVVGKLHRYYAIRYGFDRNCDVVVFSGDNPCSLAGLNLSRSGDVAISMGTSDTMFGSLTEPRPSGVEGHVFASSIDPTGYMVMLVRKNASLTRERIRDSATNGSWAGFSQALRDSVPGNGGRIGFYLDEPEITPPMMRPGYYRFDGAGNACSVPFAAKEEVRAIVESQFLTFRLHAERIGMKPLMLLATGGASSNLEIVKVMADVFGLPVRVSRKTASASLGAAYRAYHGWLVKAEGKYVPFSDALSEVRDDADVIAPDKVAYDLYGGMMKRFAELEAGLVAQG